MHEFSYSLQTQNIIIDPINTVDTILAVLGLGQLETDDLIPHNMKIIIFSSSASGETISLILDTG